LGISCVWIFKGHQLAFEHSEDWQVGRGSLFSSQWIQSTLQVDYASYDWVKLDPSLPATRDVVNQYWRWDGIDQEGRKFCQGKIFK